MDLIPKEVGVFIKALRTVLKINKKLCDEIHTEIHDLTDHLSKTVLSLADVLRVIESIETKKAFDAKFNSVRQYCLKYYFGNTNLAKARTRCSDLRRAVDRIRFKTIDLINAPLGGWAEAQEAVSVITNRDQEFEASYEKALGGIRDELNAIDAQRGKSTERAWARYQKLQKRASKDLTTLDGLVREMTRAEGEYRAKMGS